MNIQTDKKTVTQTPPQKPNPELGGQPSNEKALKDAFEKAYELSKQYEWPFNSSRRRFWEQAPILERAKESLSGNKNAQKAITLKMELLEGYICVDETFIEHSSLQDDTYRAIWQENIEKTSSELKSLFENNPGLEALVEAKINEAVKQTKSQKK